MLCSFGPGFVSVPSGERLAGGGQEYSASPVAAGRHFYFSGAARMGVARVADQISVVAAKRPRITCLATRAIVGGALFFPA
jgi:hypothetical protein